MPSLLSMPHVGLQVSLCAERRGHSRSHFCDAISLIGRQCSTETHVRSQGSCWQRGPHEDLETYTLQRFTMELVVFHQSVVQGSHARAFLRVPVRIGVFLSKNRFAHWMCSHFCFV